MIEGLIEGLVKRENGGFIHEADPRVRGTFPLILAVSFALSHNFLCQVIDAAFLIAFVAVSKSLRRFIKVLMMVASFSLLVFLFSSLGAPLAQAALSSFKFAGVLLSFFITFMLFTPDEIELVLRWLKLPNDFVFLIAASFRFAPLLISDIKEVVENQMSRGFQFSKNPILLAKRMKALMVPIAVTALERSEELADAMIFRGYGMTPKPTSMYELKLRRKDLALLFASATAGFCLVLFSLI